MGFITEFEIWDSITTGNSGLSPSKQVLAVILKKAIVSNTKMIQSQLTIKSLHPNAKK